jgi:hypothetical protein
VPEEAVAAVFARAAEIDLHHSPQAPATLLDEEALVEIGAAVGLSPAAIRQAVAEHHAGALVPAVAAPATWVGPRLAVAEQRLTGDPDRLRRAVERDLERQWFRKVRDQDGRSVWAARTDLPARVARRVDFRNRLVLQGVSALQLTTVACGQDEVLVRLEADPAERRNTLGWKVAATAGGGATVGAVLAALSGLDTSFLGEAGELLLFVLPAAGLGGGGGLSVARRSYLEQLRRLADDLEGTLDRLRRTSWG